MNRFELLGRKFMARDSDGLRVELRVRIAMQDSLETLGIPVAKPIR